MEVAVPCHADLELADPEGWAAPSTYSAAFRSAERDILCLKVCARLSQPLATHARLVITSAVMPSARREPACSNKALRRFLPKALTRSVIAHPDRTLACRDMNAATSQEVFAGPYLTAAGPQVRQKFSDAFIDMTVGFLAFPLCVPGTAVWRGRRGRLYILSVLRVAAAQSKAAMKVRCSCTSFCSGLSLVRIRSLPFRLGANGVSNRSLLQG